MSNTHEHLEQAEHAQHAFSGFDRKVVMTIAVIAAALAGVSVLGHRAHNQVLSLQAESNRLRTEAAAARVETSNQFAWYQAKRQRQAQSESFLRVLAVLPIDPAQESARKSAEAKWAADVAKYEKELPEMEAKGHELEKESKRLDRQAEDKLHESHFVHRQANRLDIGHLAVELGLVLGSIAVLTKRRAFWLSGIVACVLGLALTGSAYVMEPPHDEHAADSHGSVQEPKDGKKGEH
ncbi:MAG TPA: DUF4337 domain-containing protein [Gemmataceae bacterium]|nr:DUF4337 domain-containing protein [Gemmataceae bacterium]